MENKPTKNAWYCYNKRQRNLGLKELTYEEFCEYSNQHEKDTLGRNNTNRTSSIGKMLIHLGTSIFRKKKVCVDCGESKLLKEFTYTPNRRGKKYVEAWCRDCNKSRHDQYVS